MITTTAAQRLFKGKKDRPGKGETETERGANLSFTKNTIVLIVLFMNMFYLFYMPIFYLWEDVLCFICNYVILYY